MKPSSYSKKIIESAAQQVRNLKKEKYSRTQKLLRNWKPIDPYKEYKKEIKELRSCLDELIEAYEMMSYSGSHLKEFDKVLEKAKRLIDF